MYKKEENFKEKFRQALISTAKVISDDYKPLKITFYNVDQNHFRIQKNFDLLIINYQNCKNKIDSCDESKKKKIKEILPNRYMFIYD